MKIAFVLLAHQHPEQIFRLIESLRGEDQFFIHIDKRAEAVFDQAQRLFRGNANVRFIADRHRCYWGNFNIVNATLECLKVVCEEEKYDYVVLISGQDYPLKPLSEIKLFLEKHRGQQFIEAFPLLENNQWTDQEGAFQAANRVLKWHFFLRSRHFYLPVRRTMPNSLIPYGGSQWWALTSECVRYLVDYVKTNPNVMDYFKNTFIADELFFQTLVCNSPFKEAVTGSNLRYIDWSNPNPVPPRVLTIGDFESVKNSNCLFARKLDPDRSADLLNLIDQKLLCRSDCR